MTINERFEFLIKTFFGGNKRAFAIHVGVSPTVVENVVGKRQGKPSFDFLEKVCANANISAEWLLLGIGEMAMDIFEPRKLPMVFHTDPERYIKEGKKEITDEEDSSQPNTTLNKDNDSNQILLTLLKEKDQEIGRLNQEIGRLKARNEELEKTVRGHTSPQHVHTSETVPT